MPMSDYMREVREKVGHRLLEVPSVSVAVRDEVGRVLLVKHAERGVWVTPGGAVEPLERPADAAVREMWEETGLHVRLTRIVGVYGGPEFVVNYNNGDSTSYMPVLFEAEVLSGTPRPDGVETLDIGYFTRDEIADLEVPEWFESILTDVFSDDERTRFHEPEWSPDAGD